MGSTLTDKLRSKLSIYKFNKKSNIETLSKQLGIELSRRQLQCAVAESCTGGQLAAAITVISGCSQWFDRGFICYSNQSKIEMLGVNQTTIDNYGAVSEETAYAMVNGAITHSHAQCAVSITGIAGPDGGTVDKPVGTVWIAWFVKSADCINATNYLLKGQRAAIQKQAVALALQGLIERIKVIR